MGDARAERGQNAEQGPWHTPEPRGFSRRKAIGHLACALSPSMIVYAADIRANMGEQSVGPRQVRTRIPFEVMPLAYGGFLQLEFRILPRLTRARLSAPDGRQLDLTHLLRRLPADQAAQPQRGDFYTSTDILRDPATGHWHLELEHQALGRPHVVAWQTVLQPRFEARLRVAGHENLRAGEEATLVLETRDYGVQAVAHSPGVLRISDIAGHVSEQAWRAGSEPGHYESTVVLPRTGAITLSASPAMRIGKSLGEVAVIPTSIEATVQPGLAPASGTDNTRLMVQARRGADACLQSLEFQWPWHADRPGLYVLSVALPSRQPGPPLRVTGSMQLQTGPAVLVAQLRGSRLQQWAHDTVVQADTVEVIRVGPPDELLARRSQVALSEPLAPERPCRS